MTEICGAPYDLPGITCQKPPHDDDRHLARRDEGGPTLYVWTTAEVEAEKRRRKDAYKTRLTEGLISRAEWEDRQ